MSLYSAFNSRFTKRAAAVLTPEAEQAAMQGGMGPQGGMPPQGAPTDPSMMGAPQQGMMPPGGDMGGMPPQGAPVDPAMAGGAPPPPELLQNPQFMQFLQEATGIAFDQQSGQFIDMQQGQPVPPDVIMQLFQQFMQQTGGMPPGGDMGGMPPQGAPTDPSMMGAPQQGMTPPGGDMGGMPPEAAQPPQGPEGMEMPPEIMQQVQKTVDDSIRAFSAQLDKKLSALLDKIDVIKDAIEEYNNTDDRRSTADKEELRGLQEDLRNELEPSGGVKTASTKAFNVFDLI